MEKKKAKKTKLVGRISTSICKKNNILCYSGYEIVQSLKLIYHVNKHVNDFISVDSFNKTIANVDKVISSPYYVYYDPIKIH